MALVTGGCSPTGPEAASNLGGRARGAVVGAVVTAFGDDDVRVDGGLLSRFAVGIPRAN